MTTNTDPRKTVAAEIGWRGRGYVQEASLSFVAVLIVQTKSGCYPRR